MRAILKGRSRSLSQVWRFARRCSARDTFTFLGMCVLSWGAGAPESVLGAPAQQSQHPASVIRAESSKVVDASPDKKLQTINFGNVNVGSVGIQTVTLINHGSHTLTIQSASITGSPFSLTGISPPVSIQGGASFSFSVDFTPTSGGTFAGTMTLTTSGPSPGTTSLNGTGVAVGTPYLTLTPASLTFGPTVIGQTASLSFQATNTGTASVTISSGSASGTGFTLSGLSLPLVLDPNQSQSFAVDFAPSTYGTFTGQATLISNATDSPTVESLSGTAHVVDLSWVPSTSPGVTSYNVYKLQPGGLYAVIGSPAAPNTTYQDWNVTPGQTYSYYVTAVSSSGESAPSNCQSAQVPSP